MELFNVKDVAAILKVNEETVRRWIRRGELPAKNLGGKVGFRIKPEDLETFLVGQKQWDEGSEKIVPTNRENQSMPINKISEIGLNVMIKNLLDDDSQNVKEIEVEIFQKKHEINRRRTFLINEIEKLKKELAAWDEILKVIQSLQNDYIDSQTED